MRKFYDCRGHESCSRIVGQPQFQFLAHIFERERHLPDALRFKGSFSKIWSDWHDCAPIVALGGSAIFLSATDARGLLVCCVPVIFITVLLRAETTPNKIVMNGSAKADFASVRFPPYRHTSCLPSGDRAGRDRARRPSICDALHAGWRLGSAWRADQTSKNKE